MNKTSRVIQALDVPTGPDAMGVVSELRGICAGYKIGKQLHTACGPQIIKSVISSGGEVFLDLKFHDIPNTVAMAALEAANQGVFMFNVHAMGGLEMMSMTMEELDKRFAAADRPKVIAVTLLTSHNYQSLLELQIMPPMRNISPEKMDVVQKGFMQEFVVNLAMLAQKAGLDGVVASVPETPQIRQACGKNFLIVTPGIRPLGAAMNDQNRTGTPSGAIMDGADYLVIGRPILKPAPEIGSRLRALELINDEVSAALAGNNL